MGQSWAGSSAPIQSGKIQVVQMWQRLAQFMWQGEFSPGAHVALRDEPIQFRLKCGRDDFRLGTDVARARPVPLKKWQGVSPVPAQMWQGVSPVPAQMWQGVSPVPAQMWQG